MSAERRAAENPKRARTLRVVFCGAIFDGKTTLLDRLQHELARIQGPGITTPCKRGDDDNVVSLEFASPTVESERCRETGITTDVAYRYLSTARRDLIAADAPGHEDQTRNMAAAASNSDAAVIVVDARKGMLLQSKRHLQVCSIFGIRHAILAVNKMDLVEFDKTAFDKAVEHCAAFAKSLGIAFTIAVPVSARLGTNVAGASLSTPWYDGPPLIDCLEAIEVARPAAMDFRFPVQWMNRAPGGFLGLSGSPASGVLRAGDEVVSALSGRVSKVARIVTADGDLDEASSDDAITLVLTDDVAAAQGDVLSHPGSRPEVSNHFAAHILWLSASRLLPQRSYAMRIGTLWTTATISAIKYKFDAATLGQFAGKTLELNDVGFCNVATARSVPFDIYAKNRGLGAFILVDRTTNETAAAGMIAFGLRRATNIHIENLIVDKADRARSKNQQPTVIWFTGLSGSGKSTIAKLLEKRLHDSGHHTYVLDGDNMRHGLNRDLGFTDADRVENIRRIGEVAKLFADAGLIVLCSFISPFRAERQAVRENLAAGEFVEVFVDAPLEECRRRDPKGLYAKVAAGKVKNFTGVDSPYEAPQSAELQLDTMSGDPEAQVDRILEYLRGSGRI